MWPTCLRYERKKSESSDRNIVMFGWPSCCLICFTSRERQFENIEKIRALEIQGRKGVIILFMGSFCSKVPFLSLSLSKEVVLLNN